MNKRLDQQLAEFMRKIGQRIRDTDMFARYISNFMKREATAVLIHWILSYLKM